MVYFAAVIESPLTGVVAEVVAGEGVGVTAGATVLVVESMKMHHEIAAPGSLLVMSHATASANPEELDRITDLYNRTCTPLVPRDHERFAALFAGWDLVEPGVVYGPQWRPEPGDEWVGDPSGSISLAAVGVHP